MERGSITPLQLADTGFLLYLPTSARTDRPVPVLLALRGMGDNPQEFANSFVSAAEENGWLLVVPELTYGDWKQVEVLKSDARKHLPWMKTLLDALPRVTSAQLCRRILLYGFSMGGQYAHRFALAYPQQVLAAALMSSGTYTLPLKSTPVSGAATLVEFPMGVSDLDQYSQQQFDEQEVRRVTFWVGVGERDNAPGEVPRSFDHYIGPSRVDRAKSFAQALSNLGAPAELVVFPHQGHVETTESRSAVLGFLKKLDRESDHEGRS